MVRGELGMFEFLFVDAFDLDDKYLVYGQVTKDGKSRLWLAEVEKAMYQVLDIPDFASILTDIHMNRYERKQFKQEIQSFIHENKDKIKGVSQYIWGLPTTE